MSEQEELIAILKAPAALQRFLPIRVVLRKQEDGTLLGLVENSFSMDVSKADVRIWWSGRAYSMLGEHKLSGIEDAEHNAKPGDLVVDPLSDDCPITIDWDRWLAAAGKYEQRNARFKMKEMEK